MVCALGVERISPPGAEACVCECVRVRVVRVPQYGAFRDYSSNLICVESGQHEYLKSYMTSSGWWREAGDELRAGGSRTFGGR